MAKYVLIRTLDPASRVTEWQYSDSKPPMQFNGEPTTLTEGQVATGRRFFELREVKDGEVVAEFDNPPEDDQPAEKSPPGDSAGSTEKKVK